MKFFQSLIYFYILCYIVCNCFRGSVLGVLGRDSSVIKLYDIQHNSVGACTFAFQHFPQNTKPIYLITNNLNSITLNSKTLSFQGRKNYVYHRGYGCF